MSTEPIECSQPIRVITHQPDILGGRAIIKGTRVSVADIVARFREYQIIPGVVDSFLSVNAEQVEAALAYYMLHPDEIEAVFRADDEFEATYGH